MAKDKKGFVLYADQKELFEQLPDEKAGELIKHIFKYVNDENPTTEDLFIKLAFTPIKQQLKRDLKKFEATKEQRSRAGKRSAEVRKEQRKLTPFNTVQRDSTKATVTVKDTVTVKVKVKDKVKEIIEDKRKEEIFREWLTYRKQINKEIKAERTVETLAKRFNEESLERISFVVNNSIENNWQGLFWDKAAHLKQPSKEVKKEFIPHWNADIGVDGFTKDKQKK